MTDLKDSANTTYGMGAKAADWVATHSRSAIAIGLAVIFFFALVLAFR